MTLLEFHQKIPDWLVKTTFLGKVEAPMKSRLKSIGLVLWAFSTSDAIWGLYTFKIHLL